MESLDLLGKGNGDFNELKIGMEVLSEDEAYRLYCEYAMRKGFSVRKGNFRYVSDGVIRQREYLCAFSGHNPYADPSDPKKIRRLVTRMGCKALIRFTVTNGVWKISHFNDDHNHEFVAPEERQFLRINRNIDSASASIINSLVDAGIKGTKAYSYLSKEVGGSENVGFTQRDCHNFINQKKQSLIKRGDAQSIMNHFKCCQIEDHMFFHCEELDEEGRLANFFWRDGRSKLDYDCFGDVVVFDTTYRTNKYNMICAPFIGVNHHRKNILFGCAFILNETTDSFVWLFENFLAAMENKAPMTIFTDQCQAMANAIKKVFPNTCHRLCSWHISKNATQNIGSLYANYEFKGLFHECLNCETKDEFESTWDEMITRFGDGGNKWLKTLYGLREKWCPAFSLDTFTLRLKSTQRSESMNNVLHKMSCKTMTLMEFVLHYEEQCEKMRLAETNEDFRCKHGMVQPTLRGSGILEQAASVYTVSIYYLFEEEFLSSLMVHLEQLGSLNTLHSYRAFEEGHKKHRITKFDSSNCNVMCSCKMFESTGWLCRHALKVLNSWNITKIPSQYIIDRWRKCAKVRNVVFEHGVLSTKKKSLLTLERNFLLQQAYRAINYFVLSDEGKNVAKGHVQSMLDDVQRLMESCNLNKKTGDSSCSHTLESCEQLNDMPILDPSRVREKGVTNARIKSHLERKKRRKKGAQRTQTSVKHSQNTFGSSDTIVSHVPISNAHSYGTPMHANFYNPSPSHEAFSSSWNFNQPGFSFIRLLQHNNQMQHLNQDFSNKHDDPETSQQMLISQHSINPINSLKDQDLNGSLPVGQDAS